MGRAYGTRCRSCDTRVTVLESADRVGVSPSPLDDHGIHDEDATVPGVIRAIVGQWPPCPTCGRSELERDPNSTDVLLPDDEVPPPDKGTRRRASDRPRPLRAQPPEPDLLV